MYHKIPIFLKDIPQWVSVRNGSKLPFNSVFNVPASVSAPNTWTTFKSAENSVINGGYDGVGFVFANNGIVGIDIDDGFENGRITTLALDIILTCGSYTEISRSGRGVHIFVKGRLPFKGRNNFKGVEVYQDKRYFICTGKRIFYDEIIENQDAIEYVLEKYFAEDDDEDYGETERIYNPKYIKPTLPIRIRPEYPAVGQGGRHLAMVSLAGQLHTIGWSKRQIYTELLFANSKACDPPLPEREVKNIVSSVTRYRR